MANAKKCDLCEKFYDVYGTEILVDHPNDQYGRLRYNLDVVMCNRQGDTTKRVDQCLDCAVTNILLAGNAASKKLKNAT